MRRAMAVVLFLVVMAFIVRAPEQTLGEGIGQAAGNAAHFVVRMATPESTP